MTYQELKQKQQEEFNALPLGFAFSNSQFDEMMKEWGLNPKKDLNKIYSIGAGGFIQRKDAPAMHELIARQEKEMKEFKKELKNLEDAFLEEMLNHEYGINNQGDYDVLSVFGDIEYCYSFNDRKEYFKQLAFTTDQIKAYNNARKRYFKMTEEWF